MSIWLLTIGFAQCNTPQVAPGQDVPAPDAKPTYGTLHATVVAINPDQVRGCLPMCWYLRKLASCRCVGVCLLGTSRNVCNGACT